MNADLQEWLSELRTDSLVFADEFGGANANLWSISLPSTSAMSAADIVAFVLAAADVRAELVAAQGITPVTFYAWHDEMAGQLRFSTARCTFETLPFAASVRFVKQPMEIVCEFLASPYRDGILLTETSCTEGDKSVDEVADDESPEALKVWARRLA